MNAPPKLSPREIEICERVRLGETDKEIGAFVGLKESTVGSYLKVIYGKLGVNNRAKAAVMFDRMTQQGIPTNVGHERG